MGHAASTWTYRIHANFKIEQKIDAGQRGVLIRFTGSFRTTSTETLAVVTGILPLHLEITRMAAMY